MHRSHGDALALLLFEVGGSNDKGSRIDAEDLCPATDNHHVEGLSGSTSARKGYGAGTIGIYGICP